MKRTFVAMLSVFLAACGQCVAAPSAGAPALLGRWILVGEPVPGCLSASLEFTPDDLLKITSGAQVLEASIKITHENGGFLISTTLLRHNDEPNCQGRSAIYVAQHFAPLMFVRFSGSGLTALILDKNRKQHGPKTEFRRDGV